VFDIRRYVARAAIIVHALAGAPKLYFRSSMGLIFQVNLARPRVDEQADGMIR
jgi:hypothetical protein